jgi:type VI secretion system protein ImpF
MPVGPKKNRLSPPLMYVFRAAFNEKDAKTKLDLRDEKGERVIAVRRARAPISEWLLRSEVKNDVEALMNTIALESTEDLEPFEAARKSILNFGLPDIAHRTIDEFGVLSIGDEIRIALMNYEPRIAPGTIDIRRDPEANPVDLKLRFIVKGDLICNPVNVPVEFFADVEVDDRKIAIGRL